MHRACQKTGLGVNPCGTADRKASFIMSRFNTVHSAHCHFSAPDLYEGRRHPAYGSAMSRRRFFAVAAASLGVAGCGALSAASAAFAKGADNGSGAGASSSKASQGKLKVVASFYPMADFSQKVGGDLVEVTNLVPAGTEPHEWEPSPSDIKAIQACDVFVYNGADMEGWVDDLLASADMSGVQVVEASKGITLRAADHDHDADEADDDAAKDADEQSGSDHDHEGTHDPHVWLNPLNALAEMGNIRDGLIAADPSHEDDYQANYDEYAEKFEALDKECAKRLGATKGKVIVVSHEAYGYLCDAYGLTQMPITGMDAEGEPDAQAMAQVIDFVRQNDVKVIFSEDLVSPKVAEQIANETGASCEVLNPIEGLTDDQLAQGEDYFSVMRSNLDELVSALNQE